MTRFSGRFGVAIIVTFVLALAPILYARGTSDRDECVGDSALFDAEALHPEITLISEGPRSTNAAKRRMTGMIGSDDDRRAPMVFTVKRTFGLPNSLLQPAATLPGEREPDVVDAGLVEVGDATIPVRYGSERFSDSVRTTAYFMAYRGEPIASPLLTRLRAAVATYVGGRWPITLFVVSTSAHPARQAEIRERLDSFVESAWSHYHEVCTQG